MRRQPPPRGITTSPPSRAPSHRMDGSDRHAPHAHGAAPPTRAATDARGHAQRHAYALAAGGGDAASMMTHERAATEREHGEDEAAAAARLVLQHRLFPRAMAWNVHNARAHSHPYQRGGGAVEDAANARHPRVSPFATMAPTTTHEENYQQQQQQQQAGRGHDWPHAALVPPQSPIASPNAPTSPGSLARAAPPPSLAFNTRPSVDARERLFRTMGKYLDPQLPSPSSSSSSSHSQSQPQPNPHSLAYAPPPPPQPTPLHAPHHTYASPRFAPPVTERLTQRVEAISLAHTHTRSPSHNTSTSGSLSAAALPPRALHSLEALSSAVALATAPLSAAKKRSRLPGAPPARPGESLSLAKRCSVADCTKIAVSKGLCRGHGGGRRCTFTGCNKCAQSRSPFCWAHGGGKRCEAPHCRRSRKTKHYCVDHVDMEPEEEAEGDAHTQAHAEAETIEPDGDGGQPLPSGRPARRATTAVRMAMHPPSVGPLSMLAPAAAWSHDDPECDSVVSSRTTSDTESVTSSSSNATSGQAAAHHRHLQHLQHFNRHARHELPLHQHRRAPTQLPSLSDALKRTFPPTHPVGSAVATATAQDHARTAASGDVDVEMDSGLDARGPTRYM